MNNDEMLMRAKDLAAATLNTAINASDMELVTPLTRDDMYVVWFSKTLQNWKALVSTNAVNTRDQVGDYIEVTYNGDKKEAYCDLYTKQMNIVWRNGIGRDEETTVVF